MIVSDTNLSVYLYVEGSHSAEARDVLKHDPDCLVPPRWTSEILNVVWQYIQHGSLSLESALRRYRSAREIVWIEDPPPVEVVVSMAANHGITAYDAVFASLW